MAAVAALGERQMGIVGRDVKTSGGLMGACAAKLRSGKPSYAAWSTIANPVVVEAIAQHGFDVIVLDGQHGHHTRESMFQCIAAAALYDIPTLPRIGVGNFADASQLCDAGACGIIAPMINTVEDARTFASFIKFPPQGERSWGPNRAITLSGLDRDSYFKAANGFTLSIAMIETREALTIAEDILSVPGIDGFLIGPSDLSISLLDGARIDTVHPDVDAALTHVLAIARRLGKIAATFAPNAARAAELAARGYDIVTAGTDQSYLSLGIAAELGGAKQMAAQPGAKSGY
ncbi:MAG: hydroxyacid aldolase [Beijerinckiaceae bacterium]|nr:hydroxyacid aldolase [Beijerinckiaceae bacterium]